MKNVLCLSTLMLSAFFVFSGCQSTTSPNKLPNDPMFQPVALQEPVVTGEYFKEVDTSPRPIGIRAAPVYPLELKKRGVTGEATIAFVVTMDGKIEQVQVVQATHRGFADAAKAAVKQWRYRPAIKDGKPVNCLMRIPIAFNLETEKEATEGLR